MKSLWGGYWSSGWEGKRQFWRCGQIRVHIAGWCNWSLSSPHPYTISHCLVASSCLLCYSTLHELQMYISHPNHPHLTHCSSGLSKVLQETLRLYPPAPGTTKAASTEITLSGYRIPKDTQITVSKLHLYTCMFELSELMVPVYQ